MNQKIINQTRFFTVGFLIVMFVVTAAIVQGDSLRPASLSTLPTGVVLDEIDELKRALESNNLDPDVRASVERKLEMLQKKATMQAQKPNGAAIWAQKQTEIIKATLSPQDTAAPQSTRFTGIFVNPPPTGISSVDRFSSVWIQKIEDIYVSFYVGYELENPDQGIIIVFTDSPYSITRYKVPGKTGSLTIKGLEGEFLTITAMNGQSLKFSIYTHVLIDNNSGAEIQLDTGQPASKNSTAYP